MNRKEALFYRTLNDKIVQCMLCGHFCKISDTHTGRCKVRRNIDGKLFSLNYGKISSLAVDPIEKKPLYHFYPGSKTLSLAMQGCNLKCPFCQNHKISQVEKPEDISGEDLMPEDIIKIAKAKDIKIISYTYTEPTIYFEFMLETAMLARAAGLKNVVVTNGFMSEEALEDLLKVTDAYNVDLKSFRTTNYEHILGGKLELVLSNLYTIKKSGAWLELTTLLIPGFNDSDDELEDLTSFIKALGKDTPWHISAYHPDYKMLKDSKATNVNDLKKAFSIAMQQGLEYVYLGNVLEESASNTRCPKCQETIITRKGNFYIEDEKQKMATLKHKCEKCGYKIKGVF